MMKITSTKMGHPSIRNILRILNGIWREEISREKFRGLRKICYGMIKVTYVMKTFAKIIKWDQLLTG